MNRLGTGHAVPTEELVSELLPSTALAPESVRRVNFFVGLSLFWLFPRRYGPHLAVSSTRRAILAHGIALTAVVVGLGTVAIVETIGSGNYSFRMSDLRTLLAEFIAVLAAESAGSPWSGIVALVVVCAVPLVQLLVLLVGTAVMPFCAGGDRASSVWKRSVKNIYWSTTLLIPASVGLVCLRLSGWNGPSDDMTAILTMLAATAATAIVILRAILTGACRYVGPPDGPAFAARQPRCDECGYHIFGLPVSSNCPECGLAIRESLPPGRRLSTRWQENQLKIRGFVELLCLQWRVLSDRGFFGRLPVQSQMPAARHFWWGTYLLMMFVTLAGLRMAAAFTDRADVFDNSVVDFASIAIPAVVMPLVAQSAMMFVGCLSAQLRLGMADYRVSAIACYYASPLMWPFVLTVVGTAMVLLTLFWDSMHGGQDVTDTLAVKLTLLLGGGAAVGALIFWWFRVFAALRAVQYANA